MTNPHASHIPSREIERRFCQLISLLSRINHDLRHPSAIPATSPGAAVARLYLPLLAKQARSLADLADDLAAREVGHG
jgi:hypothetical protein